MTGPAADRAAAAAVKAADGPGVYEVEVRREDGSQVEIHLNGRFEPVGSDVDDDTSNESEDSDD